MAKLFTLYPNRKYNLHVDPAFTFIDDRRQSPHINVKTHALKRAKNEEAEKKSKDRNQQKDCSSGTHQLKLRRLMYLKSSLLDMSEIDGLELIKFEVTKMMIFMMGMRIVYIKNTRCPT